MVLRQLHVVFGAGGLMAGCDPPVHPLRLVQDLPRLGHLLGCQDIGDWK